jgi:hypothetical protein
MNEWLDARERNTQEIERLTKRRTELLQKQKDLLDRLRIVETYLQLAKQGLL